MNMPTSKMQMTVDCGASAAPGLLSCAGTAVASITGRPGRASEAPSVHSAEVLSG